MESLNAPPAASTGTFLTPLLISMLGIIATFLAIIVYHFVLVRCCLRRQRTTATAAAPPVYEARPTGVDEKVLKTIPVMVYSSLTRKRNVDQSECAVCLGEMEDEDMVRLLPNCKHAFHLPCIDQWLMAHVNCPLCRSAIVAEEKEEDDKTATAVLLPAIENTRNCGIPPGNYHVDENTSTIENGSSSGMQSFAILRHCYSLVLPMERRSPSTMSLSSRGLIMGLNRSLSMDQSCIVVNIETETESERGCSSPFSSSSSSRAELTRSRSYRGRAQSTRHFDRMSSKLLSSFSRLRVGKTNGILPH